MFLLKLYCVTYFNNITKTITDETSIQREKTELKCIHFEVEVEGVKQFPEDENQLKLQHHLK